jgi:hypothetical protein
MSTQLPREKISDVNVTIPGTRNPFNGTSNPSREEKIGQTISKLWVSEGHPINRKTGQRIGGGPFHVSHTGDFIMPGHVSSVLGGNANERLYSGPVWGLQLNSTAIKSHHESNARAMNESSMNSDGATAISLVAPNNPTANLASSLAESYREGVPSLPGIQSWKRKAEILRNAGSEYLNYQFGWAPLTSEIHGVVNAARHHRDIMQNYRHNEGRDVHRRFDFPVENTTWEEEVSASPASRPLGSTYLASGNTGSTARIVCERTRKRWFEGCFTYGGPGGADNFSRALGFGSEADAVYGLTLTPDVLWNLTPWSWAVDWFTNAGDVIHNVTNFALAGLVMRYGYMMEETISTYHTSYNDCYWQTLLKMSPKTIGKTREGGGTIGQRTVHKSRCPANPFGFGVGWEGLSPTQLAITAALGITRAL